MSYMSRTTSGMVARAERGKYAGPPKIVIRLDPHSKAQVIESERWQWPQVVEPVGARIISSRHAQGARGGYWVVEIAVPRLLTADEFVQNYSEDDLDLADNRQRLGG